jgi:hypothetical protein
MRDLILPGEVKCYDPETFESLVKSKVEYVNYNKIAYVPKTARTSRTIAVEPLLNGFVQKGVDKYMRSRLRKVTGIDLTCQDDNAYMAYIGSKDGSYCTIDLSSASDSISLEVVRDLLPADWFEFLDEIRSPSYQLPSEAKTSRYEKFTSMGNGFCFPLETLIFASLCYAATVQTTGQGAAFTVYGDDIIVKPQAALLLTEFLREMGFVVNTEKSFYHGPFRESCGADWYEGQDVRPVNLDDRFEDVRNVMSFHNSFLRSERAESFSKDIRSYLRTLSREPVYRPSREPGDTAFSVSLDTAMSSRLVTWNRSVQQWRTIEILSLPADDKYVVLQMWLDNNAPMLSIFNMDAELIRFVSALRSEDGVGRFTLRYTTHVKIKPVSRPWSMKHHGFSVVTHESSIDRELSRLLRTHCASG